MKADKKREGARTKKLRWKEGRKVGNEKHIHTSK